MTMIQSSRNTCPSGDPGTDFDHLVMQLAATPTKRTKKLVRAGMAKKARKLVEEATEVSLQAVSDNRRGVIAASVALLDRLAVLWRHQGVAPAQIRAEMDRRAAVLGIAAKPPKKVPSKKALKVPPLYYRDGDRIGPVSLSEARPR